MNLWIIIFQTYRYLKNRYFMVKVILIYLFKILIKKLSWKHKTVLKIIQLFLAAGYNKANYEFRLFANMKKNWQKMQKKYYLSSNIKLKPTAIKKSVIYDYVIVLCELSLNKHSHESVRSEIRVNCSLFKLILFAIVTLVDNLLVIVYFFLIHAL